MAHVFPIKEELGEIPFSEKVVYDYLSSLNDDYTVFHSVQWSKINHRWKSTWKENDFLVFNRKLGALVLEVKGGEIEYRNATFYQRNTLSGEVVELSPHKKKDPLSQAIDGVYHYRRIIDDVAHGLSDRFPVEAAVWFPSCSISQKFDLFPDNYQSIKGAVLSYDDLERKTAIHDIFSFYDGYSKTSVSDEEYNQIINAIAQDFNLVASPKAKHSELDNEFLKLTNEQAALLDYISEQKSATIQGVAGTGKTLIAKEAARRFANENRQVLFLCFNKFLFSHLKREYPCKNVDYYNIHSLLANYSPGSDTSTLEKRAAVLSDIDYACLDYDDVIIDEAQDFINEEICYFKKLAEMKGGHFLAFYDKNQLLTTEAVPQWINDSDCKLLLTKNCRNTYEIAKTSYNVIDIETDKKTIKVRGEQPTISFVNSSPVDQVANLINKLTGDEYGYEYSDIVILSMKTERTSLLKDVGSRLAGIPISSEKTNSSVQFTTASKFKGLESRAVIIIDIDKSCFSNEDKKRLFYVACSRATQDLSLLFCGTKSEIDEIGTLLGGRSGFNSKAKIAMKTQTKLLAL